VSDKSPRKNMSKKSGKTIKEKRAEKKLKHPDKPDPLAQLHKR
jgi:hypothetical protein